MDRPSDSQLHRYFDGDLSPEEAAEVRRQLEADPALAAKVQGLAELRGIVHAALSPAGERLDEAVPSDDLWARIEGAISQPDVGTPAAAPPTREPAEAPSERPALRVLPGGGGGGRTSSPDPAVVREARRRRIAGIVVAGLALAAAVLLIVLRPGESPTPGGGPIAQVEPGGADPTPETPETVEDQVFRTEVLEVDFGENSGAIFAVEGDAGERYAVVWLADVQPKRTALE
jgi:hypothetical protein